MERIGDFAKRCQTTIKTLRYYDQLKLLVPDYIDNFTGYRYYGPEKLEEMNRITSLKDIGYTLEEIKRYCDAETDDIRSAMIEEKKQSLKQLTEETAKQLELLETMTSNINVSKGGVKMNAAFENDERVIGRWESLTTARNREHYIPEELYFLPDGEPYWGYSWTKDYLKISFGDGMLCPYEIKEVNGEPYMFISNNILRNNDIWVLRQTDKTHYKMQEIGMRDDVDFPFVNDEEVIGTWNAVDFVQNIEDFNPDNKNWSNDLYYTKAEFLPGGVLHNHYGGKNSVVETAEWTKGITIIKDDVFKTAPAYEIRNGYLFIEWKSGDYVWGKLKPYYYVFKKEAD